MITSSIVKKLFSGFVVLSMLAGLVIAALPTGVVAAATPTPTPGQAAGQGVTQADSIARLGTRYQNELKILDRQGQWVDRTEKIVDWVNKVIDRLLGKGKAVEPLKDALTKFKAGVDAAKASHDSAAGILNAHSGFDVSGKVIDIQAARETVRTAGWDLQDASLKYRQAALDLRISVRDYVHSLRTQ